MSLLHYIHHFKQQHPHSRLITNFIEYEIQRLSSIITSQFKSSNIQKNIRRNASNKKHHLKFVLSYDNVWCEKISKKAFIQFSIIFRFQHRNYYMESHDQIRNFAKEKTRINTTSENVAIIFLDLKVGTNRRAAH